MSATNEPMGFDKSQLTTLVAVAVAVHLRGGRFSLNLSKNPPILKAFKPLFNRSYTNLIEKLLTNYLKVNGEEFSLRLSNFVRIFYISSHRNCQEVFI